MELIDKAALVAEIEKRFDKYSSSILRHYDACTEARASELGKILVFLNTLEAKEVDIDFNEEPISDDLEQAAITTADEDMQGRQIMEESNENRQLYSRIFRRGFKAGVKWHKNKKK